MEEQEAIKVYLTENKRKFSDSEWNYLLVKLPPSLQHKILKYQKWEDRQASLLGKLLLMQGLLALQGNPAQLQAVQYDQYQRPFIAGGIDFNIAHTDGMVACALGKGIRLGIDIERIIDLNIADYRLVFTDCEYDSIIRDSAPLHVFFKYWTRKEAVIKADGRGFYLDPKGFSAIHNSVYIEDRVWQLQCLKVPDAFAGHLATDRVRPVRVQEVTEADFFKS